MTPFTPWAALAGGVLIGLAAVLLLKLVGRIAGISGVLNGALTLNPGDRLWRFLFLAGLILGGYLYQAFGATLLSNRTHFPISQLILSGLLVGIGNRIGGGCTSRHGVGCLARRSVRTVGANSFVYTTDALH